ncbi:H-NS family nucleoid-associated regulatory protein [Roseinatronobacter monicus]|uniref:DNA-binding protein H-NS n=1 Tax=Roseinatronobacter monicus TaxID=393481 RepID=A0A543K3R8_9RHOB|nr:H-NS histone family protein [Roseinatronobacter monicus]TQM89712.1 DNA-binding protein H-NS [Roseinatronobacter monicus]TQM89821.1 DNA-binding protein H-NS [Roseinatronobacter monicus]
MDLHAMSLEELKKYQKDIQKAVESFEARQLAEARAKLEGYAREMGVKLEDVMAISGKAKSKTQGSPKYRHPENPALTWTGRGRKPDWFKEALEAGMNEDALKI